MTAIIFHVINCQGSLSVKQYCHWTITSNDAFEELELIGMQKRKMQPIKNTHSMLAALKSKINQSGYKLTTFYRL